MDKETISDNIDSGLLEYIDDDALTLLFDSVEDEEENANISSLDTSNLDSIIEEIRAMDNPLLEIRKEREELDKELEPDIYEDLDDELLDLDF